MLHSFLREYLCLTVKWLLCLAGFCKKWVLFQAGSGSERSEVKAAAGLKVTIPQHLYRWTVSFSLWHSPVFLSLCAYVDRHQGISATEEASSQRNVPEPGGCRLTILFIPTGIHQTTGQSAGLHQKTGMSFLLTWFSACLSVHSLVCPSVSDSDHQTIQQLFEGENQFRSWWL